MPKRIDKRVLKSLKNEQYENSNKDFALWSTRVPTIRNIDYVVLQDEVGGDQPKRFIKEYVKGETQRRNLDSWTSHIAKFPRKWYPIESITEHLLTRIGQTMGMKMANSKLRVINGQVRFLSEYFLGRDERLIHGAEIFSIYLNDKTFVEEVEEAKMEKSFFNVELAIQAIETAFRPNHHGIIEEFQKMLVFDAIIGVNDRHFYNWGVIQDIYGERVPVFSPLYDTSRGLLWNEKHSKLQMLLKSKQEHKWLENYINGSRPKLCFDNNTNLNHFDFLAELLRQFPTLTDICRELSSSNNLASILTVINNEFKGLMSPERLKMVQLCLEKRFSTVQAFLK